MVILLLISDQPLFHFAYKLQHFAFLVHKDFHFFTLLPTLPFFFIISSPTGVRIYITVVLIYLALMCSDVEHLFIYLLANVMLFKRDGSSSSLPILKLGSWIFTIEL